jgi:HlyD family secretion protein
MNSTVVQNVVTYDTIIDFDNPERKLFPGMTAYVTIPVATAKDVIEIPNAALRFKPDLPAAQFHKLYQKAGIPEEGEGAAGKAGKTTPTSAPDSSPKAEKRVVWKLHSGKTLEPVRVKIGITDHTSTELLQAVNGQLKVGDELITGMAESQTSNKGIGPAGPRRP